MALIPEIRPCRKLPAKVYIRIGVWSTREPSMNWTTGEYERGTSVYPAKFVADGVVGLDFEDDEMRRWDIDHEAMEGRLWWPVTGKEVCRGSDGEPVLQPSSVTARPFAIKHGWMKELYS